METGGQAIIVHQVASGPRHEARDALPLIRRTEAVHPVGYSMDKAYDSEEIRRVVVEERRGGGSSVCDSAQERSQERNVPVRLT